MTLASDQVVATTCLRETLIQDTDIASEFAYADSVAVFWEHVPDNVPFPYIVISHILGGSEKVRTSRQTPLHG